MNIFLMVLGHENPNCYELSQIAQFVMLMLDSDLVFRDQNGQFVVLMHHIAERLQTYRQLTYSSPESAGVLIGERRGAHIIISDLSVPGDGDIRSRCRVDRRGAHHQTKVISSFHQSEGTAQYIGEWHTHPEDHPTPSAIDKLSWSKNLDTGSTMVLIIVGRQSIWLAKKEKQAIEQCLTES